MNMRNIVEGNRPSKYTNEGDAWAQVWDEAQRNAKKPVTVIYGHDARRVPSSYVPMLINRDCN